LVVQGSERHPYTIGKFLPTASSFGNELLKPLTEATRVGLLAAKSDIRVGHHASHPLPMKSVTWDKSCRKEAQEKSDSNLCPCRRPTLA
jgi:hypothetical protein